MKYMLLKTHFRTSLVVLWLRIRLLMQGTRVRALVREDPTCRRAAKPVRHNYWACTLDPASHNYRARVPQLLKPARLEPVPCNKRSHWIRNQCTTTKSSPRSLQLEKACEQQQRPNTAKNKNKINKFIKKKQNKNHILMAPKFRLDQLVERILTSFLTR